MSERVALHLTLADVVVTWFVTGPAASVRDRRTTIRVTRSGIVGLIRVGPYARSRGLAGDGGTW